MNLFDIVGPIMVGPSSSHTAGAAKIGLLARKLLADDIISAQIQFHGSFLATGKGHGTDKALVAGLMGMHVDDARIPDSLQIAHSQGINISFHPIDLGSDAHPNSVRMYLHGKNGRNLELIGASIGGGRIEIHEIDELKAVFSGDHPTLIVQNDDTPGVVAAVASRLSNDSINIATMQLERDSRGGKAVLVIELDQELSNQSLQSLSKQEGILKITYLSLK